MPKQISTRQKVRRTLQQQNAPGRLGKRPIKTPRVGDKQRGGKASRRRAGR